MDMSREARYCVESLKFNVGKGMYDTLKYDKVERTCTIMRDGDVLKVTHDGGDITIFDSVSQVHITGMYVPWMLGRIVSAMLARAYPDGTIL